MLRMQRSCGFIINNTWNNQSASLDSPINRRRSLNFFYFIVYTFDDVVGGVMFYVFSKLLFIKYIQAQNVTKTQHYKHESYQICRHVLLFINSRRVISTAWKNNINLQRHRLILCLYLTTPRHAAGCCVVDL